MNEGLSTSITTRSEFSAAVKAALADAAECGTRELWFIDPDFSSWPLSERDTVALLIRWAQVPQCRLHMLALHYDEMQRRHPRFVEWRRTWGHTVHPRALIDVDVSDVPTLLLAGSTLGVRLIDRVQTRGHWFRDATEWTTWREVADALSQRSTEAFPSTILGL